MRNSPRKKFHPLHRLLALILIAAGVALYFEYRPGPENVLPGWGGDSEKVETRLPLCSAGHRPSCVVDGDTLRWKGTRIRIADLDAPEIFSPRCAQEKALGIRATNRLRDLLNQGPFEIVWRGGRDEDKHGRKLRYVERGGVSLGETLIAEGLARRWGGGWKSWCG